MNKLTKNRIKLLLIIGLFGLPPLIAWVLFSYPKLIENNETKNYGALVAPAVPSELSEFLLNGPVLDISQLKGRWVLMHVDLDGRCDAACIQSTHLVHQLNVLLSKDASRLKRVYLDKSALDSQLNQVAKHDQGLNVFKWQQLHINKLKVLIPELADGDMLLVDPLGNIMMKYRQDADPYGIQKDLKLLFKASQIG